MQTVALEQKNVRRQKAKNSPAKAVTVKAKLKVVGGNKKVVSPFPPEERQYFAELHRFVDSIYKRASDEFQWTWNQLAGHAGLAALTVQNLGNRVTKYPRYHTVHKLAKAVGLDITVVEAKTKRTPAKVAAG